MAKVGKSLVVVGGWLGANAAFAALMVRRARRLGRLETGSALADAGSAEADAPGVRSSDTQTPLARAGASLARPS